MKDRGVDAEIQGYYCPLLPPSLLHKRLANGKSRFSEIGLEKRCPKCNEYWPHDTEYWFAARQQPDGLFTCCRACYMTLRWPAGRSVEQQEAAAAKPLLLPWWTPPVDAVASA